MAALGNGRGLLPITVVPVIGTAGILAGRQADRLRPIGLGLKVLTVKLSRPCIRGIRVVEACVRFSWVNKVGGQLELHWV